MSRTGLVLVAFGGNALVPRGRDATQGEQLARAREVAEVLLTLAGDRGLVLVHGNGPQVGDILIRVEEAVTKVPPLSLGVCVAQSQGSIGFFLEWALRNALTRHGLDRDVVTLMSLVRVRERDPAMERPSKPVGPFYTAWRAEYLMRTKTWPMVEQDRGWRRVVPSPRPVEVLGVPALRNLLDGGNLVITGGGGGVPVVRTGDGTLQGVEAVIDKDYTAALLARELGVDLFVILTDVESVERDFGTDRARPLDRLSPDEARRLLEEGQFPRGSMGPKVEAALSVVEDTGRKALITSAPALSRALAGENGTWLVPAEQGPAPRSDP
jgi:carbamate kinase